MRLLLVILTLALLPLRGWATDMLAPDSAQVARIAINSIAHTPINTWARGLFDAEHQPSQADAHCAGSAHVAQPNAAHSLCQASSCCPLCQAVFVLPEAPTPSARGPAHPVRAAGPSRFASVAPTLLLKPPIA